ncbi:hypothetical protein D3C76_1358920 [compost metagenome]
MYSNQALLALVGNDITARADVFHCLRIAKASQWHPTQNAPIQRQLDQLGTLVGYGKQAVAIRIEGQRRDIVIQTLDRLRLEYHPVLIQANTLLEGLPPGLEIEPPPLVKAIVLPC